jgi:superfamily II DNA/RNA helicase
MPTFDPSQFINTNPVEAETVVFTPRHTFTDFGFDNRIVRTIKAAKLTTPTPIQDQVIPEVLNGRDVVGLAETGTGKTAAFLLPLIHRTLNQYSEQTLILTPTRELALQIEAELRKFTEHMKIYSTVCVGGTSVGPQIRGLKRQNHFVIGTPGRVLDLINRGIFRTEKVTTVVLDEADRMLDMGFIHDMRKILEKTPKERNTLLFSATMNKETEALSRDFLRNASVISVKKKDVIDTITQNVVRYSHTDKFETLSKLLSDASFTRVIIFGAMKHSVEKLSKELTRKGIKAESIHGNKSHNARQRSLKLFKSGNARVLVATDVAARGIHVDDISHVINYDLPNTFDDYVHRIGRTGRGTKRGKALTFVQA